MRFALPTFALLIATLVSASSMQAQERPGILWARSGDAANTTFGTEAKRIAVDPNGDVVVAGQFYDSVRIGGVMLRGTYQQVFIARFTRDGVFEWAHSAGGANYDDITALALDREGNAYITGYFNEEKGKSITFDAVPHEGSGGFLAKYGRDGSLAWAKLLGPGVRPGGVAAAPDGTVVLGGSTGDTLVLGSDTVFAASDPPSLAITGFVARFNAGGTPLMARTGNRSGRAVIQAVTLDHASNIIIAGQCGGMTAGDTLLFGVRAPRPGFPFVEKLDPEGRGRWIRTFFGKLGYNNVTSLACDGRGRVVMGSTFNDNGSYLWDTMTVGNRLWRGVGYQDMLVVTFDSTGEVMWSQLIGGRSADRAGSVLPLDDGTVYVTGGANSIVVADSVRFFGNNLGGFLCAFNETGRLQWVKTMDSPALNTRTVATSIARDSSGAITLAGWFTNETRLDNITLGQARPQPAMGQDLFIARLGGVETLPPSPWKQIVQQLPLNGENYAMKVGAVQPFNGRLYMGMRENNGVFTSYSGTGLFVSDDYGDTWNNTSLISSSASANEECTGMVVHDDTLFYLVSHGSGSIGYISRTGGGERIFNFPDFGLYSFGDNMYAASGLSPYALYRSDDHWRTRTKLGADSTFADFVVTALVVTGDTLVAGTVRDHGILRSTDGGSTWNESNTGLHVAHNTLWPPVNAAVIHNGRMVIATSPPHINSAGGGVYISDNGGATWRSFSRGLPFTLSNTSPTSPPDTVYDPVFAVASIRGTLLAGTARGLFGSTDDGASWSEASVNLPIAAVNLITHDDRYIYVQVGTHGLWRRLLGDLIAAVDAPAVPGTHAAPVLVWSAGGEAGLRFPDDRTGHVRVTLHDITGRDLGIVGEGEIAAGSGMMPLRTVELRTGVYLLRVASRQGVQTIRMVVVR